MKFKSQWLLISPSAIMVAVAFYFLWDGTIALMRLQMQFSGSSAGIDELLTRMHWMILLAACGGYGAWRVVGFHPAFNANYRTWLTTTPWTADIPLPLGPIHLVWQDAVVLIPAALLAYFHARLNPLYVATAFGAGYVAAAACALLITRRDAAYWLALGLAVVLREAKSPVASLVITAILCLIAHVSLQRSLEKFPWDLLKWPSKNGSSVAPFDHLSPQASRWRISAIQGMLLGVLIGAWVYAIGCRDTTDSAMNSPTAFFLSCAGCACCIRVLIYMSVGYPPISPIGRLATGHLILPGYDKIFIAPLCAFTLAGVVPDLLIRHGFSGPAWAGISAAVVMAALFSIGPTLTDWRLTGANRIPSIRGAEYIKA